MISSLPGKAENKLVDIARLAERFNMFSKPGLVNNIKQREPGILFISVQATSDYDVIIDFRVDSMSLTASFKICTVIVT